MINFRIFAALFLFIGCSSNSVKYALPSFKQETAVRFEQLSDELLMSPHRIFAYRDWIILIGSNGITDDTFFLYDKSSGKLILSDIKYGNGPKETTLGVLDVSFQRGVLSYYDLQSRKRLSFSIDEYLQKGAEAVHEEKLEISSPWIEQVSDAGRCRILIGNKGFFSQDTVSVPHIQMRDSLGHISTYSKETIPDASVRFYAYNQPLVGISPDGKKMAVGSSLGAILETFRLSPKLENNATRYFSEPKLEITEDNSAPRGETIVGFGSMSCTDYAVFATFDETCYSEAADRMLFTDIAEFDWDGNPVRLYRSDCGIEQFCVDPEEEIVYAVISDQDNTYYLAKAKMD